MGAVQRGAATLAFHVTGIVEDGDRLPMIRSLAQFRPDRTFRADAKGVLIVSVPLDPPRKATRLNISLDERLVEQIDRAASALWQTRSGFLAEAAKSKQRGAA